MKNLIIITSYYYFLNVLNLIINGFISKEESKFLICDNFSNYELLYKELDAKGYSVEILELGRRSFYSLFNICLKDTDNKKYQNMYLPTNRSNYLIILYVFLCARHGIKKINYIEDGFSLYAFDRDDFFIGNHKRKKIMEIFVPKDNIIRNPDRIWLYRPEYMVKPCDVARKIPEITSRTCEEFTNFFKFVDVKASKISSDIVYFATPGSSYINKKLEEKLIKELDNKIWAKCITYKEHPRSITKIFLKNMLYMPNDSAFWEYCLIVSEKKKRILVSVYSTTMYSGMFLFNNEDEIIFLYKFLMSKEDPEYYNAENFVYFLRKSGLKVHVPIDSNKFIELISYLVEMNA